VIVARHETDLLSLVFAIVFVALGATFLTGDVDVTDFFSVWALPTLFLSAGLVLVAVAVNRYRRNQEIDAPVDF
jgi:hypothetical protein